MSKAVIDIALIEISLDIKIAKGIVDIRVSDVLHQGIFSVLFHFFTSDPKIRKTKLLNFSFESPQ